MRRSLSAFAAALIMSVPAASAADPSESAALTAAQKWLGTVDKGAYTACWQEAGAFLKTNVTQQRFAQQLTNVRKPLGTVLSRKVLTEKLTTNAPGAPDGKYVEIQFKTSFTGKKSAIESVRPALEKDGQWRVAGYWIK